MSLKQLDVDLVPQELAGLVAAFNDLLQRLSRSIEQTRRFTADASHQMRTPLAILRTHLDVVTTQARSHPEVARSFDDIRAATDRLQRLLTQLLALARAEETSTPGQPPACDVNDIAAEACREFAPAASEAGLEIHLDQTHAVVAPIEPILLREILLNLFDNSAKYHESGTHIQVQVGFDNEPFLTVADDGRGIPSALLHQATDRFSRLARDNHKPGSGLGLPIVAAICESYGATLSLASSDDRLGLSARIGFPLGTASPLG
jgi:two-component system sensor histidine kinase TctE